MGTKISPDAGTCLEPHGQPVLMGTHHGVGPFLLSDRQRIAQKVGA